MDRRPLWTGLLVVCSVALFGARFRGCEGGETPPERRLPESTGPCVVDDDCVAMDMCIALACVGGTCIESGVLLDDDGDRYAPFPCGDDCDDNNPTTFPGATEVCDGVDQDCDGNIDEDAPGIQIRRLTHNLISAQLVDRGEGYIVIGTDFGGVVSAFTVDAAGATGAPTTLDDAMGASVLLGAARDGSEVHVVIAVNGALRTYVLTVTAAGAITAAPGEPLAPETDITALDFAVYGGRRWLLFDTRSGARVLVRDAGERIVLRQGTTPPRLATDGRLVAATDGEDTVRFFAGDGSAAGAQTLPGEFAFRGLASGDGVVYAAYHDAFDHALTRVTPGAFTSPVTAPFGAPTEDVSIFYVAPRLMTVRTQDGVTLGAWLYNASLGLYEATYEGSEIAPDASPVATMSVATTAGGVSALLVAYRGGSSSSFSVLQCR